MPAESVQLHVDAAELRHDVLAACELRYVALPRREGGVALTCVGADTEWATELQVRGADDAGRDAAWPVESGSAHGRDAVADWLTVLGYPPSRALH